MAWRASWLVPARRSAPAPASHRFGELPGNDGNTRRTWSITCFRACRFGRTLRSPTLRARMTKTRARKPPFPLVDEARPAHHTTRVTLYGSMKIVIYQKPTCTTCRQVHTALVESGVDFDAVDYYVDPIPKKKLLDLLRKMRLPPRALLRTKEPVYKTLRLAERDLTDDEIVDLMVKNPDLIQRPIVEKGARAILARPAERLKEIL